MSWSPAYINYFDQQLSKKSYKTNHLIFFKLTRRQNVNSYHDYSITKLNKKLNIIAYTKDGSIGGIAYNKKFWCYVAS